MATFWQHFPPGDGLPPFLYGAGRVQQEVERGGVGGSRLPHGENASSGASGELRCQLLVQPWRHTFVQLR